MHRVSLFFSLFIASVCFCVYGGPPSNNPRLPGDGYPVAKRTNAILFDGQKSGMEWSEGKYQTFGPRGEVPGLRLMSNNEVEDKMTDGFTILWDPDPQTGGIFIYGSSDNVPKTLDLDNPRGGHYNDGAYLVFDPNTDGENSVASEELPDGYMLGFAPTGPRDGLATLQRIEDGKLLTPARNLAFMCEAHVNLLWGHNGGSKYGGMDRSGLPSLKLPKRFELAVAGTTRGWEFELFMPWTMFDACSGGKRRDGDGLCVGSVNGAEDVKIGDEWYFDFATNHNSKPGLSWGASAGGCDGWAQRRELQNGRSGDPTIVFVEIFKQPDPESVPLDGPPDDSSSAGSSGSHPMPTSRN